MVAWRPGLFSLLVLDVFPGPVGPFFLSPLALAGAEGRIFAPLPWPLGRIRGRPATC